MTAKRKAELQRKLALAPVPKPPADLADRIKSEIPKHVVMDAEKERVRLRQAVAFNVRVAASILLLVSSVYLALHLLSRKFGPGQEATTASNTATETAAVLLPTTPPPPATMAAKAERADRKQIIIAEARQEPVDRQRAKKAEGVVGGLADAMANSSVAQPAAAPPAVAEADDEMVQRSARAAPAAKSAVLAFDIEAAAAPFDASKQVLRVSLDGAREATLDVAFNDDTVASWHTIASDGTSLYEITLRPQTGGNDVIATVRLNSTERVIRRGDLRSWNDASRRMKYASLAAALEAGVSPKDVAAKARAAGLDDLAALHESAPSSAAEVADGLEVHVEVVSRGAHGARDRPLVLRRNSLQTGSHVQRKLRPATAAQRVAHRLVEIAPRTARRLRQSCNLFSGQWHSYAGFSHKITRREQEVRWVRRSNFHRMVTCARATSPRRPRVKARRSSSFRNGGASCRTSKMW